MAEDKSPLTTPGYAEIVREGVAAAQKAAEGLTKEELADEAGIGRTTLHRLAKGERTSTKTAEKLRSTLKRRLPAFDLPPPLVPVENRDHYKWCRAGAALQKLDPGFFQTLMQSAWGVAGPLVEAEEKKAEALRLLEERQHAGGSGAGESLDE